MTDNEIRNLVRAKLADGTLREPQVIAGLGRPLVASGVSVPDPCAVCGGKPSEVLYDPDGPRPGPAFHERCFQIWHEEISGLR
jgi:hypothetical protein